MAPEREHDPYASAALDLLLPHLGDVVAPPESVDARNPSFPDQRFDYAVRRTGGRIAAVEVTLAWHEQYMAASAAWTRVKEEIEAHLTQSVRGRFHVSIPTWRIRADRTTRALITTIEQLAATGQRRTIYLAALDITVSGPHGDGHCEVLALPAAAEFERGPEGVERFVRAVDRKAECMSLAGAAGFETHLAVVPWLLGSPRAWIDHLRREPLAREHPQNIWAVDLFRRSTGFGRVQHIWPLPNS